MNRVSDCIRDLHKPEPQFIPIPMSDGDEDPPPQDERKATVQIA